MMANMMHEHIPQDARMHYVITSGGSAPNVVPDFAEVFYYVRHPSPKGVEAIWTRLEDAARGAALGTGTDVEWEIIHGNNPLLVNEALARMMDRVFDNYVMGTAQLVVNAYIADAQNPDPEQLDLGRTGLLRAYRWLEGWLADHSLPLHVSLVTCAAAPALFYADWVERIPEDCPRVAALRAEILALPPVARCIDDARPYRHYFPLGAPDRD